ncbi:adenosylcobinamide amidohydrolase [Halorarum salinum]|uniref:Adenosylcobinamide amidohydrolase n=1 Tax=Halorarum salinum TaxID=2743089 RepID=A0A7D5LD56_9EURY|nr:adenosylcobinamide amidohydrolase [Halobaculum salinum]QLG63830.1 adenosylcobinamide amidohydrolase [Halobaculum salinum]
MRRDGESEGSRDGRDDPAPGVFEAAVRDGVCRLRRPGTRWLSTGANGGESVADAAYNVTVPDGWPETDLATYVRERRERAGFLADGASDRAPDRDGFRADSPTPALLTGVDQRHARRARSGPVEVVATAGLSNPASLPVVGFGTNRNSTRKSGDGDSNRRDDPRLGTVNVVVGAARSLTPGALANLVAVAAEAKAATLLAAAGFPGTTTDAVVAGCDPDGERAAFSGSATVVGDAARICVRDAVLASLESRYSVEDRSVPDSVADAEYGTVADGTATVSRLTEQ